MASKLKTFGLLILLLLALAVVYVVAVSFADIGNKETNTIVISGQEIRIEIADKPIVQAKGLSGRDAIGDNEGMLFVFNQAAIQNFWMKGMKFSIDIIWIKDNEIVGFEENVQPEPGVSDKDLKIYSSPEPVDKVLEVKAGSIQRFNIGIGNKVKF